MLYPIGKIKLIHAGEPIKKLDLWGEQPGDSEGRLRFTDICIVLDWDVIAYLDEDGCEIQISAHDRGPLKGLTTDVYNPDQELVVVGRKDVVPKRAMDAIMMSHLTPIGNCGTSSYLLKEDKNVKKLFAMREQVQSYLSEMDEVLERLSKVRIK